MIKVIAITDISDQAPAGTELEVDEHSAHVLVELGVARMKPAEAAPQSRRGYRRRDLEAEPAAEPKDTQATSEP